MKKLTLSGCLTRIIITVILVMGFVWVFSLLFPRAYNVLEAKALGIEEDSATVVAKPPIVKKDTAKVVKPKPKDFTLAVKLEHEGNCYLVPTKVNGIPMKMLLDTGASSLTISVVEYEFLRKQKLLNDTSARECEATIANGQTVKCYTITIEEIEVGGQKIKDVECQVMMEQDAPTLLGMGVLKKLGNISIDYQRNLLILK